MRLSTLRSLICPNCGGSFQSTTSASSADGGMEYGVLTCSCSEFPVVAGIPVFKRDGSVDIMKDVEDAPLRPGPPVRVIVDLVKSGSPDKALLLLLIPPRGLQARLFKLAGVLPGRFREYARASLSVAVFPQRAASFQWLMTKPRTTLDVFDFLLRRLRVWVAELYNYFSFRFGTPRHLAGLSLASLLPTSSRPILDLGCGFGHFLHYWAMRRPGHPLVGLDRNFFLLYVARHWMVPAADYVCCAADATLPFASGSFGDVFSSDSFHYFLHKVQCARESRRVLGEAGSIVLSRVRNPLATPRRIPGPTPDAYPGLFDGLSHRLIGDRALLGRYLQMRGPELARPVPPESLAEEPYFSLVAAGGNELFRDHAEFDIWPHGLGRLVVNPLYRECGRDSAGNVALELTTPSQHNERQHPELRQYMPDAVVIGSAAREDLARGRRSEAIDALLRKCVVIGVPERYC